MCVYIYRERERARVMYPSLCPFLRSYVYSAVHTVFVYGILCTYIYIYIHTHMYVYTYIYIYIHTNTYIHT